MKKKALALAVILLILFMASNFIGYSADKDYEFFNGSMIEEIKVTEKNLDDLVLLGKVWGYLKYYHPTIGKGKYNWDYELFRFLPNYLEANSSSERDNLLSDWITSLGAFKLDEEIITITEDIKIQPDLNWIDESGLSPDLVLQLRNIERAKRSDKHYYIDLVRGVGNPDFKNEKPYSHMSYPDAGFRLLSLYRYWNIIEYYFPYKHLIEENWDDVLKEFIPKFIDSHDELEYKLSVLELIARIHDTHASIWGRDITLEDYWGRYYGPLEITFIEDQAVVTGYHDTNFEEKSGIRIGDIITNVNGKSVESIIQERLKYTPASNYPTQLRNIAAGLLRSPEPYLDIEYVREGKTETTKLQCYDLGEMTIGNRYQREYPHFEMINDEIAYLYMGALKTQHLSEIMPQVANTKGLIIDLRSYPKDFVVFTLGEHLMPQSTDFVKFSYGSISTPGLFRMTPNLQVGKKNENYYKGQVVILINELTQSSAEYTTMAFRVAPKVSVIGSTTAGADGNMSYFKLPGGINTAISGIGVYYPDGTETQRIGIVPDIEVRPTIEGIQSSRDEVLEKAIELISQ